MMLRKLYKLYESNRNYCYVVQFFNLNINIITVNLMLNEFRKFAEHRIRGAENRR